MRVGCALDREIELDPDSGELVALWTRLDGRWVRTQMRVSVTLRVGGAEERGLTGGLAYPGAQEVGGPTRVSGPTPLEGVTTGCRVTTSIGHWIVVWSWEPIDKATTAVRLSLSISPSAPDLPPLRAVDIRVHVPLADPRHWVVEVPGNQLRRSVPVCDLPPEVGISPATGSRGSSAVVSLHSDDDQHVLLWPLCLTEPGQISISPVDEGLYLHYELGLAGDPSLGQTLEASALVLDAGRRDWERTKATVASWFGALGISAPSHHPEWIAGATILEAQLGFSPFWGGHHYSPYPDISALRADLPRLVDLGFDCIQLMPRQPYPSYNIHDLMDITTTYAPEHELRDFVAECHERGVRVILDILMHGVIDQEAVRQAADGVRSGPLASRLNEDPGDLWAADPNDWTPFQIAWSRHVLDFEPHWSQGSPARSPLLDSHPEWFFRDSAGAVTGVYTHALDVRNSEFADYFIDAALSLVQRLDIDGFRFDAPTYNGFPNWSQSTREHASASVLACNPLFERLRAALKAMNDDLLLYTEPSGIALRAHMDVNYNYDEAWIPTALLAPSSTRANWTVATAHDFVHWMCDRDALLPAGSLTAHHLDSHDTFWWPEWGSKWRREQFGLQPTIALTVAFLLSGGPFMVFIGGESGMEEQLTELTRIRRAHPALSKGSSEFRVMTPEVPAVFSVVRRFESQVAVVLVNLSSLDVQAPIELPASSSPWMSIWDSGADSTSRRIENQAIRMGPWSSQVLVAESV